MLTADDGCSRREHVGCSIDRNMVLIYSPGGTKVYDSRSGEFEGIRSVCKGVKVVKLCSLREGGTSYSLVQTPLR